MTTVPIDLLVEGIDGMPVLRRSDVRLSPRLSYWADQTLGYRPVVMGRDGVVQMWFRSIEDRMLYTIYAGQSGKIEVN